MMREVAVSPSVSTRQLTLSALALGVGICAALGAGCTGNISGNDPGSTPPTTDPGPGTGPADRPADPACALPEPGRTPLRRLTRVEYDYTVRDLLGDTSAPGTRLLTADSAEDNADVRTVGPLLAEQYFSAAEEIATKVVTAGAGALACDAATLGEEACATQLIDSLGARAYRRPLPDANRTHLLATYQKARAALDYKESLEVVIATLLQASRFLYRIETSVGTGVQRLDGYALASRLSYLFLQTMPDETLWTAAAGGKLDTDAGVLEEAKRLAADPRASGLYPRFFERYLELEHLKDMVKDTMIFPTFTPELPALLGQETQSFIDSVMATDGSFRTLLTGSYTMVNGPLAAFYGLTPPAGDAFVRVELDPSRAVGLLTQPSVLAIHSKVDSTSPVHRGMFIQASLLCGTVPPPPANVEIVAPDPDPSLTTRQRFTVHRENPLCNGCHRLLDAVGLAFEHYDALGRYRDTENGLAIDDSGELYGSDVDGPFVGPRQLGEKLAQSPQVLECFAKHWFRLSQGRRETPEDHCSVLRLNEAFNASNQDVRQLALALTQTDAFLYRRFGEPAPATTGGMP
jgi:hypothetical protein